jgi:alpha-L-rhamnosidase
MQRILLLACFCLFAAPATGAGLTPTGLLCENLSDPLVVDVHAPRLSWVNIAPPNSRGQYQTAWEIRVASTMDKLLGGTPDLWSSGRVESAESFNIPYGGKPLTSRQDCWWQVRVWDRDGRVSGWSQPAFWGMGLLSQEEWTARWIGAPWQDDTPLPRPPYPARRNFYDPADPSPDLPPPAPMLRKSFKIDKEVVSARAFVTGLGFFEFYVNGEKAGDEVLVPNVTLYHERDDLGEIGVMIKNNFREYRVMYLAYDIKHLLTKGENILGAMVGNGFYNTGNFWCEGYGTPSFIGQIYIKYADGTEQMIVTDRTWKAAKGPVVVDLVFDGEHYDARLEQPGWAAPGFDDSRWETVAYRATPIGRMKAHMSPVDRVMEVLHPLAIERLGQGHYRIDFGEEISGWLHLHNITGRAGHVIEMEYISESTMGDNTYTMKGGGPESYAARFTWFVFREVEIRNWPGELTAGQIRAEAVYSDVSTTGSFTSSNPLLNTIHDIWWRTQTDNMHGGIVSDCPHRERNPYNGDGQVACITVMHNFDVRSFYTKWIEDMLGSQNPENGYVPNCSPWQPGCGGGPAWGSSMVIMPWEYYVHYGDIDMLKNNFIGMQGYIDYMLTWTDADGIMYSQVPDRENPHRWINLGEWVTPGDLPPADLVHTFYLWRCAYLTAKSARALGKNDEAARYQGIADKTRTAFHRRFYDAAQGSYGPSGGNVFALVMGVPDNQRARVVAALERDIVENDGHLDTGIYGTQFLFEILTQHGLHDLAYSIMDKRTYPSYGWWIEQGATTMWEHWDGSGSLNHPMFGGGIVWLYRKLAGMNADPEQPGYRHIIFRPQPVGDISYASYSNLTPYGQAGIDWRRGENRFSMDVIVPVGSTATVYIPVPAGGKVTERREDPENSPNIKFLRRDGDYRVYSVKSGHYSFTAL